MSRKSYKLIERCSQDQIMTNEEIKHSLLNWFSSVLDYGQELQENKTNKKVVSEKNLLVGDKK